MGSLPDIFPDDLPAADDLTHYPVLKAACDMDREFGHLVRLAVALASQAALDREEPWVVAATAVGGTEVDEVVQQLQQSIRAYRLRLSLYQGLGPTDELVGADSKELEGSRLGQAIWIASCHAQMARSWPSPSKRRSHAAPSC